MSPDFLKSELPLVAAPMAGGPTTSALVKASLGAGALAFLAAGYKTPEALATEIADIRATGSPFGVNLFVPNAAKVDAAAFAQYAERLRPEAEAYGLELDPMPVADDDAWDAKVDLLCADPVPLVSFTFGLAPVADIARLQRAGSAVISTVTTVEEARAAEEAGVDALVVQGPRAGGHSGTWTPSREITQESTADIVSTVRAAVSLPLIAAGGVDGSAAVQELIGAGASAVAVGTLLLRTDEAGTSKTHREALADPSFTETAITRVFTGRPARALRNGFLDRHIPHEVDAYPAVHFLTRELRKQAGAAGDTDRLHLWAGTGFQSAKTGSVADTLRGLAASL